MNSGPRLMVDREQVLAYRVAEHGFDRATRRAEDLRVLDLGVQESQASSARLALVARLPAPERASLNDELDDAGALAFV